MEEKTNRVLTIEGFAEEEGIKIRYELPKITSDMIVAFYRAFIVQLCEHIAKLEGAYKIFEVVEEEDGQHE
jgi:hypothetical protein